MVSFKILESLCFCSDFVQQAVDFCHAGQDMVAFPFVISATVT